MRHSKPAKHPGCSAGKAVGGSVREFQVRRRVHNNTNNNNNTGHSYRDAAVAHSRERSTRHRGPPPSRSLYTECKPINLHGNSRHVQQVRTLVSRRRRFGKRGLEDPQVFRLSWTASFCCCFFCFIIIVHQINPKSSQIYPPIFLLKLF